MISSMYLLLCYFSLTNLILAGTIPQPQTESEKSDEEIHSSARTLPSSSSSSSSSFSSSSSISPLLQVTNLRIEGLTKTFYELPIISGPRNITTASGGTHICDGTNLGANPTPGNTPTDALAEAGQLKGFTFDGTFQAEFDDFFITRIATDAQTATQFWGILVNFQFTPVGGCQFETKPGDDILWAFDAFNKVFFLKAEPAEAVVKEGGSLTVTVTDGTSGVPVPGASIDGVMTGADGVAVLAFPRKGVFTFKAQRSDSLRSNAIAVAVV